MKGISPMLATILLVAFTVAIGGIVSVWMSSFTRTTQSNVESAATDQTKCAGTYIDFISVTTTAFVLMNRGSQNITNIKCFTGDGVEVTPSTTTLESGNSTSKTFIRDQNTSIICSGKCLSIGVTGECKSGQSCWI
jgi:flagellin-like protein